MLRDRRVWASVLFIAFLAVHFWASSRVPALNEKALMGGEAQLDPLGFDVVFPVQPDHPFWKKVAFTTANWAKTNKRGMTFGVLFAAALMTFLTLFKRRSFKSGFANTIVGLTIGSPLGVCVNCAAPIAKGLSRGGAPAQTMLAAMVSSPTMNIIVLTMLFSLFPPYLVAIKLGLTLLFILVAIPVTTKILAPEATVSSGDEACAMPMGYSAAVEGDRWYKGLWWLALSYPRNLWYIVRITVPLMFVAGFLGALLINLVPWNSMATMMPQGSLLLVLAGMFAVAAIGLFLPVPIAFDVIVVAILLAAGMPTRYAAILLFTLGIFSIYSLFVIWSEVPKRVTLALCGILIVLGVVAGVLGDELFKRDRVQQQKLFVAAMQGDGDGLSTIVSGPGAPGIAEDELVPALVAVSAEPVEAPTGLSIGRIPFRPSTAKGDRWFRRVMGDELGLDVPYEYSVINFAELSRFHGIATGDVHKDGWTDVVLTSTHGVVLFANREGRFERQRFDVPGLENLHVMSVAMVDLDNDGWLDLFLSSYRKGNYALYNREGRFSSDALTRLDNIPDAISTPAPAFGDIDRDGDLDVVLGNWSMGVLAPRPKRLPSSRNAMLINNGQTLEVRELDSPVGETLTTLLTDFDVDGSLDLIIGNDFGPPDWFAVGDGTGGFKPICREDGRIAYSTNTTMSLASADVNNDLAPDLYIGQISGRSGDTDLVMHKLGPEICDELLGTAHEETCLEIVRVQKTIVESRKRKNPAGCMQLEDPYREDCIAVHLLTAATQWRRDEELCDLFSERWSDFAAICRETFVEQLDDDAAEGVHIEQVLGHNILLIAGEDGSYEDRAKEMGVTLAGWTWNAKFADLDHDGWQDLYAVNGQMFLGARESNFFYRNDNGQRFVNVTDEAGLASLLATSAYSYVDIDNDGDLDIIVVPAVGPVSVYVNEGARGNAIAIELQDMLGNSCGIGTRLVAHYGDGKRQMREIQAGGGFVSFDAPLAHFGLGRHDRIDRLEIHWSTGETTTLTAGLEAGARYVIRRTGRTADLSRMAALN